MRIVYPVAPVTVTAQRSQTITLECVVSGSPAPRTKWFKNGEEVTHKRLHGNLDVVQVTRSDEGIYWCAAETEDGTVTGANYTVNVLGKKTDRRVSLSLDVH